MVLSPIERTSFCSHEGRESEQHPQRQGRDQDRILHACWKKNRDLGQTTGEVGSVIDTAIVGKRRKEPVGEDERRVEHAVRNIQIGEGKKKGGGRGVFLRVHVRESGTSLVS